MIRPGIEPRSPRPVVNTLTIKPIYLVADGNKRVHIFSKNISPKINVFVWLDIEQF